MNLTNISEIKALLGRHGFHFSKSMGQNFLCAAWVPERIAEESGADETCGVLEVGPGIGCLTVQLARRAKKVVSIELDKSLQGILAETLAETPNAKVVFADALKTDIQKLAAEEFAGLKPMVCANLPYNVTSPLLSAFLDAGCFETVTVMVQREVARRVCSAPGSPDYGAFTVYVNWHTEPEILFDVSPGCFVPAPKVTSSVMRLTKRTEKPAKVKDEEFFFKVVRAAFAQRRKTLLNALAAGLGGYSKEEIAAAMAACALDERVRGEKLSIAQFAALADALLK